MSKNSTTLAAFADYCKQHPEERFWQALRNWSGYNFVLVSNGLTNPEETLPGQVIDTFNF